MLGTAALRPGKWRRGRSRGLRRAKRQATRRGASRRPRWPARWRLRLPWASGEVAPGDSDLRSRSCHRLASGRETWFKICARESQRDRKINQRLGPCMLVGINDMDAMASVAAPQKGKQNDAAPCPWDRQWWEEFMNKRIRSRTSCTGHTGPMNLSKT